MANPANLNINTPVLNGSINQPAVQTIDTNGTVNMPNATPSDKLFLELVNAAANAIDVTVKAGLNPPAMLSRELVVTLGATGGGSDKKLIGPLESARFARGDGSFDIQFQAAAGAPNLQVLIYRLPRN